MLKIGLFAYGEMGVAAFNSLQKDFAIKWIVLPLEKDQSPTERTLSKIASSKKIPIYNKPSFNQIEEFMEESILDFVVVCSFNKIFPQHLLGHTPFINVHLGKLPAYRGRATVNWAIINGFNETAVSIHKVAAELDSGNLYAQKVIEIEQTDYVGDVYRKINSYIENSLANVIRKVHDGYEGESQVGISTYCCTRLPEDGLIDWSKSSKEIYDFVRALSIPYPGAFSYIDENKIVVLESKLPPNPKKFIGRIPGRVISIIKDTGVEVLTGDSSIIITKLLVEGREIDASELIRSTKVTLGINLSLLYEKVLEIKK